ncbi:thioredoxin family protein [Halodesulfovibrio aestuarii]|uniref:Thioredoxin 1 n=1 Tax=Halodesulfovibrio aestuarii TaxID=126333 RepID=A0A8G2CCQ4_9BACT|nr:thioredoxin family protein [Halodesulfovibrio aestuarii]SHJ65286.1 thioredoxin 1 [Halodesulfovibrio aestuarii]
MSGITPIPTEHIDNFFASLSDAILFFHKELCPHCKNMEKVLDKFSAKTPSVEIFSIDGEAYPELLSKLSFERVPTLAFVRNGTVVKVKTGLMNPRELKALYSSL